jgi:hypothetical protein
LLIVIYLIGLSSGVVCTKCLDFLTHHRAVYNVLLCVNLLFTFCLGAITAKHRLVERWQAYSAKRCPYIRRYAAVWIILLVISQCVVPTSLYGTPYLMALLALVVIAPMPRPLQSVLIYLGKYSMGMWMVHTYYCIYLFRPFFYSFKYPIGIYLAVVVVSLITAMALEWVQRKGVEIISHYNKRK